MNIFVKNFKLISLLLLGVCIWSITMVKSGLIYDFGLGFWGPNGHDGIWHIALANSLSQGNFYLPIFPSFPIQNYHIGFDLFLAVVHKVTFIPISVLYFQIFPPIFSLLVGVLVYKIVLSWQKSIGSALWAVFFTYFGSSLGWIINRGESAFWAQQSISSLLNPPYVLSLILLLLTIHSLQSKKLILATVTTVLIPLVKIYAGILVFISLFVLCLREKTYRIVFISSSILAAIMFLPLLKNSSNLLVFQPGWFLLELFSPARLNWPWFFSAINTFTTGGIWHKAIPAYFFTFLAFVIGNLGLRIAGLISLTKKNSHVDIFLQAMILFGILFPMLFIQKGTAWNTIQFFYYAQFAFGIYAGITISKISQKKYLYPLVLILFTFTIFSTADTLRHFLPSRPPAKISTEELKALNFLAQLPSGIALTYPFDKQEAVKAEAIPPRPLYLYESTAYVSAYSQQTTFLEDEINLDITGYPWQDRRNQIIQFFTTPSYTFIQSNQIKYIYLAGLKKNNFPTHSLPLIKIFSNSEVDIYEYK